MDILLSSGFDSLLVVVDHGLTKGVILCPTKKSITAEGIAFLFFHKVFLRFGLFDKVISDCGPQFASAFAHKFKNSYTMTYPFPPPTTRNPTVKLNESIKK